MLERGPFVEEPMMHQLHKSRDVRPQPWRWPPFQDKSGNKSARPLEQPLVVDAEGNSSSRSERRTVCSLGAPPVEHKLVLRIADVDAGIVGRAGVSARVIADRVSTGTLLLECLLALAGGAEAVWQVVDVVVLADLVRAAIANLLETFS